MVVEGMVVVLTVEIVLVVENVRVMLVVMVVEGYSQCWL